jgi:hypothetical protein
VYSAVPDASTDPPATAAYQSTVTPGTVVTERAGIAWLEQRVIFPLLTGGAGFGCTVSMTAVFAILLHPVVVFLASAYQVPALAGV